MECTFINKTLLRTNLDILKRQLSLVLYIYKGLIYSTILFFIVSFSYKKLH
ncbi:hypothetical protein BACI71_90370 [Bacillus mycoides]|uniref:Uncharacterized protein n=1 Tax=Bacillus mycoides TaxID=1405 RepID=A0A654CEL9_BACMY|nr:hypothetical protein BACI71_90370 [Bacillus mycoides]